MVSMDLAKQALLSSDVCSWPICHWSVWWPWFLRGSLGNHHFVQDIWRWPICVHGLSPDRQKTGTSDRCNVGASSARLAQHYTHLRSPPCPHRGGQCMAGLTYICVCSTMRSECTAGLTTSARQALTLLHVTLLRSGKASRRPTNFVRYDLYVKWIGL